MVSNWRSVFVVGILAAVFTAIYKFMDNVTVHNFIVADQDQFTAAATYLFIGGWTGCIIGLLFSLLFGRKLIDPSFTKVVFANRSMHVQAFIAGFLSAGSTLFLLWGNQKGDPSMLIALGNAVIIYTMIYDLWVGQLTLKRVVAPILLVVFGAAMTAFNGWENMELTFFGLVYVLVISNGLTTISEIVEQKGVRASDSVNLFIWRFLWLAVTGTVIAFGVSAIRGKSELLLETIINSLAYMPWIALTMFFVFLGIGLKLFAKKDNAVSIVLMIVSVQMVVSFPITILGDAINPAFFGKEQPTEFAVWLVRFFGAGLMIWGIAKLHKVNHKYMS